MNEVSLVWSYIVGLFSSNELVNTVSIVPTFEMDLNKENIYPLVNVDLRESDVQTGSVELSFKITVIQQVDVIPTATDSKLLTDTNVIDCLNETHAIVERFLNQLLNQNNDHNIEVIANTKLTRFNRGLSSVEGWQFDIDLATDNLGSSC